MNFRRVNGSQQDFNQGGIAYVRGFGSPTGDYWMGLDPILYLTDPDYNNNKKYSLQIDLKDCNGNTETETYSDFYVSLRIFHVPIVYSMYVCFMHPD